MEVIEIMTSSCSWNQYELPKDKELNEQELKPGHFLSLERKSHGRYGKETTSNYLLCGETSQNKFLPLSFSLRTCASLYKHIHLGLWKHWTYHQLCQQLKTTSNWTLKPSKIPPTPTPTKHFSNPFILMYFKNCVR